MLDVLLSFMNSLATKKCVPCSSGGKPLQGEALLDLQRQLGPEWRVIEAHHLEREFVFKDFREAWAFVNRVAELSEAENHHPDIYLSWGKARLTIWTHSVGGLSDSDFILAAKIDALPTG